VSSPRFHPLAHFQILHPIYAEIFQLAQREFTSLRTNILAQSGWRKPLTARVLTSSNPAHHALLFEEAVRRHTSRVHTVAEQWFRQTQDDVLVRHPAPQLEVCGSAEFGIVPSKRQDSGAVHHYCWMDDRYQPTLLDQLLELRNRGGPEGPYPSLSARLIYPESVTAEHTDRRLPLQGL
jgi:hypothetical protein